MQEVFTRYADGETVTVITSSLKARGFVSSRGAVFNKNSLHKMLKNRKYIGEYRYKDIVHPDTIPPIISKELFTLVQERMEKNKKAPAKQKAPVEYLLTTKFFCGKCGAFMVGESGTSKTGRIYNYYKCAHAKRGRTCDKKTIQKDFIERFVVSETKRLIFQDDMIDRIADAVLEFQKKENTPLPLLQKQLKEAEKGIENLLDAIQQGIINASTKQRLDDLEARKENWKSQLRRSRWKSPC